MAIKKIKLPNNTTVDINDARNIPIITSDAYIDSEAGNTIRGVATADGAYCAFPGCEDGSEDYTLATANSVIFKLGTGPNSVRNSILTTSQSQASGEGGVSILGTSTGDYAVSAGNLCVANGKSSYAEGYNTETGGDATSNTKSIGDATLRGSYAHAEGNATIAQGRNSHAEGLQTFAAGVASHAEGSNTKATQLASHAEGDTTTASGVYSHAEGFHTTSSGISSHAEGYLTVAGGNRSHAEGQYTQTTNLNEHAEGKYNLSTLNTTLHSVGIGTSNSARKNAYEITTDGKHYILGVGGYDGTNVTTSGVQDLATVINTSLTGVESTSNKVTSLSSSSTDTQYPSAKCVYDNLASKQNLLYANELIGSMYRNNVAGTGNISINGTSGEFPTVSSAGEYIVVTSMSSSTQSYGLNVNFGGNTYSLTTTDGKIYDSRTVVINSNKTWSASINGSVASGTIIDIKLYKSSPIVSDVEATTNKVTSLSSSSNDNQYPSAKCVYDIVGDIETLLAAI